MSEGVIRIKPHHYIHILNNNTNVTEVLVGPNTYTRKDEEKIVLGPEPMVSVPPRHFVRIGNPVVTGEDGSLKKDAFGQVLLRFGDEEYRFTQDPFPLYPGEKVIGSITPLTVVSENQALRLRALRDYEDVYDPAVVAAATATGSGSGSAGGKKGGSKKRETEAEATSSSSSSSSSTPGPSREAVKRAAGDEWLFVGPGTYIPHVAVAVAERLSATILKPNQALRLRARFDTQDQSGKQRRTGEEWLVRQVGAYLPGVHEEVVGVVSAQVLTDKRALHLRALRSFTDVYGVARKAGHEWLITHVQTETHLPDVHEEVVGEVRVTSLSNRQYCIVLDPVAADGARRLGHRELRVGEASFFLQPGERLERGIQNIDVLGEGEALLLRAREGFTDATTEPHTPRLPGDRWMVYGPTDYVPPVQVEILERRTGISLDSNEGIYVRDIRSGKVRMVKGESHMLLANEELWKKDLRNDIELLLHHGTIVVETASSLPLPNRDRTRVVTYRAPHNSVVQIYDYKAKCARVVFGPDLVMLGPDEQFTCVSLSGSKPKRPAYLKTIAVSLGPDFMTDIITVETADHARLQLQLSYSWYFRIDKQAERPALEASAAKIFNVPDFVGDACKTMASRIRAAVAGRPFDDFHKNSSEIIRLAVFGRTAVESGRPEFFNPANNLVISSIDIQSVEPVDQRTRDSLQKSVQLAIEITTQSQEASARHEAERREQEAKARLERQRIQDEADVEAQRKELLELQAQTAKVEAIGAAAAEAHATAEAARIEGEAAVKLSKLKAEALQIESAAELKHLKNTNSAQVDHRKRLIELETFRSEQLAAIEAEKFSSIVNAIGPKTIESIARAGPEMQAKLLSGLGLQGYLVTDGTNPINLFQTAAGMIHPGGSA